MRIVRAVMIIAIASAAPPAMALLTNPFWGSRTGLTQRDVGLLGSSIDRLNQSTNLTVGSSDSWSNPASHSRGENRVVRIFQDNGNTCHTLRHEITVKGRKPPKVYTLNWCLTPDGKWAIANNQALRQEGK